MESMKEVDCLLQNPVFREKMQQLEQLEQNREYCRHGWEHCMDVARGIALINQERNLRFRKELLYALALVHDLGRVEEYLKGIPHEQAGGPLAGELLKQCGFTKEEVSMAVEAVSHHRGNEESQSVLTKLLKEADKKTRLCFLCKASDTCKWSDEKKNMTIRL